MTLRMRIDNFDTLDDGGPTWITLDQRGASVGRRASMDWILPDPAKHVSSHHFDIQYDNGAYWLRDVSTNGTYLQGSYYRIDGPLHLKGGERLIVGHYIIAVELSTRQAAPPRQQQSGVTIDPWGGIGTDADPWDMSTGAESSGLAPVNPLPHRAADPHHFDDMAQDFVPLQQPSSPHQRAGGPAPLQQPDMDPAQSDAVQQPPPQQEPANPPPLAAPKAVPMPPLANPSETVIKPPPRRTSPAPVPAAATPAPPAPQPDGHAILAAFCAGAGLDPKDVEGVDPLALVEALGKSTRVTVDEIMLMLKDRASVKQFTRGGERTMRSATGNNPMKFMPDADQAFAALFIKHREGFVNGAEGFENALSDLRRHQTAVFAALQPALAEVLTGLAPDEIAEREGTSSNLLSGSKKTRNWDAFVKRWDNKASTGDHGMLDVFLRAFAKAYADATGKSGQY
jgi:type VI secretion system protein ImpI